MTIKLTTLKQHEIQATGEKKGLQQNKKSCSHTHTHAHALWYIHIENILSRAYRFSSIIMHPPKLAVLFIYFYLFWRARLFRVSLVAFHSQEYTQFNFECVCVCVSLVINGLLVFFFYFSPLFSIIRFIC